MIWYGVEEGRKVSVGKGEGRKVRERRAWGSETKRCERCGYTMWCECGTVPCYVLWCAEGESEAIPSMEWSEGKEVTKTCKMRLKRIKLDRIECSRGRKNREKKGYSTVTQGRVGQAG
jgi:hypothetical protein